MKFTQQYMDELFNTMLDFEERSLCPVYCVFKETGFFARSGTVYVGFITCTSSGRLLMAKTPMAALLTNNFSRGGCFLTAMKDIKIKKNVFGQYAVEFAVPDTKKDIRIKFQVAPKVAGCNLPNQAQNTAVLIDTLNKYM